MKAWQAVNALLSDMREAQRQTENNGNAMIDLLVPNLRNLSPYRLARLKRALQDFNSAKKEWKS
jgi:hypothetical protein